MSRIFWDAMLLIYLVEDHPEFLPRVRQLLARSRDRGDLLFTSHLALGEVLAGAGKSPYPEKTTAIRSTMAALGFQCLPFNAGSVDAFSQLRAKDKLKVADAIHLACAASAGMDLVLTGDKDLMKIKVPGIHFIADFMVPIL